jgi:hypothetical protein
MDNKERILVKTKELFMQYGIRSVSMDDIASNMGMSKKTLYQYYADKDELVRAVIEGHITEVQDECTGCKLHAKDAIHEIFLTMEHIIEELNNMNPMVIYDMEKFHHGSFMKFQDYKNKFLAEMIRKNLEWGVKEELYRSDINVDIMIKFRLESLMIPFNVSLFPPGKYNLATVSTVLIEHFVYGLATVKGHKLIQKYNEQRQKKQQYADEKK